MNHPQIDLLIPTSWRDYALLDSGNGQKLERYGGYTFIRPEAQATWRTGLPPQAWQNAHAIFHSSQAENGGHWEFRKRIESGWLMQYKGLSFWAQTTAGRHLGVFPEQADHWDWLSNCIQQAGRPVRVLSLFGYTGIASLACAQVGAAVTHVDASKKAISWARENQTLSNLGNRPVRWIIDDALKFVEREGRRGSRYEGLILDPPKFGRGPKGEVWEFFKLLPELISACRVVMSDQPWFVVITAYAIRASAISLANSLDELVSGRGGTVQAGELALKEESAGRLLSMAITARWSAPGRDKSLQTT
jgi:23S rRNA (cytosine1962-C5)-methyltransferase